MQSFEQLQKKMQVPKNQKGGVSYSFRTAEEIDTHFKKVSEGWTLVFDDTIVNFCERLFYIAKAIVEREEDGKKYSSQGIAELNEVPVITTKTGKTINKCKHRSGQALSDHTQGNTLFKGYLLWAKKTLINIKRLQKMS